MTGYCPNCGGAVEHDGEDAACEPCGIEWTGSAGIVLKPEPYEPGELEARHAAAAAGRDRFHGRQEKHRAP